MLSANVKIDIEPSTVDGLDTSDNPNFSKAILKHYNQLFKNDRFDNRSYQRRKASQEKDLKIQACLNKAKRHPVIRK